MIEIQKVNSTTVYNKFMLLVTLHFYHEFIVFVLNLSFDFLMYLYRIEGTF